MKVDVFHFSFGGDGGKVATVAIPDEVSVEEALNIAYSKTNTVHRAWYKNSGVEISDAVKAAGGARSTSIGDEFTVHADDGSESRWVCASAGFVTPEQAKNDFMIQIHRRRRAKIDGFYLNVLRTEIQYFGRPCLIACDRKCEKAFGRHTRPKIVEDNPDDTILLADGELPEAPRDPGTYEGGESKPMHPIEHNRWCARECERSALIHPGETVRIPDWSKRDGGLEKDKIDTGEAY